MINITKFLIFNRYKDILNARPKYFPNFSTIYGPILDNHALPSDPYDVMKHSNELFGRYDLLFGVTELESYHTLNALSLMRGMLDRERDEVLRHYLQTRYDINKEVAQVLTLKLYASNFKNSHLRGDTSYQNRDTVLQILSDALVVAPLVQTGLLHTNLNPRSFMYVFGHNTKNGDYREVC